ncbi:molybdate ABC transporter substrate-binding protein [Candidatus Skiveiella danica]|jgi:molybdate transport system substrate-binding protein|uniref:molybdate ABC transporter substrate-binding protein n=1 Tax=Candidatus Skiveiella danica TaxID=3386177 RepID=UPI001B6130D1|nr:substrate-binding domain-containing protein [Comamonadaceae bacterium]MBK6558101.1 substrate-binding domain-containing protein [Comamonadaceae bacterium]MBK9987313.1 substrate-binding domain-containing protein [Betaproteobacteria bacterium]MBP8100541.1 substrate-binding domain-containing protein [Burkholderiaceae bacterium]
MPIRRILHGLIVVAAACAGADAAGAAELKVLTAGAFKPVVAALAPVFEGQTGHTVRIENDTAGALARRIGNGEAFDVVVLTPAAMELLEQAGRVARGSSVRLARVAIGVAVKQGAPLPAIGSESDFRQALLAARAVAYIDPAAGGSSGIYLTQLFQRMGIAAQIAPKAVLVPGGLVAQRLVSGEADLALHQISEILAVPGVTLVGPIPAVVQNYTVYAGGLAATSADLPAARAFLELLAGERAKTVLKDKGMEAP